MSLTIAEMIQIQERLQQKYAGIWQGDSPETAKNHLLYAVEEIGEVAAILKKRGAEAVVNDEVVRKHFCEEMTDVMMYLTDVLLCCSVSAEEFEEAYYRKANKNLQRDFVTEHRSFLSQQKKQEQAENNDETSSQN